MERPGDVVFNVTKTYTTRERAHADVGVHVQLVMVQLEHIFVPALCGGGGGQGLFAECETQRFLFGRLEVLDGAD